MESEKEDRIRAKAHEIWLSEGCPEGSETRHWEMAIAAVEAEDTPAEAEPVSEPAAEDAVFVETVDLETEGGEAAGGASGSEPVMEPAPAAKPAPRKRAPRKTAEGEAEGSPAPKRATRARKTTPAV